MTTTDHSVQSKVPRVTLAFWIVKICATTVGETGGDALSMTLNLGYAVSTLVFLAFFGLTVALQVESKRYHPVFYWAVVVATTTVGTTTSDYFDRTLGLGSVKSSAILLLPLVPWQYGRDGGPHRRHIAPQARASSRPGQSSVARPTLSSSFKQELDPSSWPFATGPRRRRCPRSGAARVAADPSPDRSAPIH